MLSENQKKRLRADFAVLAAVLLLSALMLAAARLRRSPGALVVIEEKGGTAAVLPLYEDASLELEGRLTVVIENGSVYITGAWCPDRFCQASSPIKYSGESIICLPFGISVSVTGGEGGYDFLV